MAYLKIKWRKDIPKNKGLSAKNYETYLLKERGTELVANCHNCTIGCVIEQFKHTQSFHGKDKARRGENLNVAFEVIHSFSPEESKILSAEKINLMGTELAKRYFGYSGLNPPPFRLIVPHPSDSCAPSLGAQRR